MKKKYFQGDKEFSVGVMADAFRKLSVRYAGRLADQMDAEIEVPAEPAAAADGAAAAAATVTRPRTADEAAALYEHSVFGQLAQTVVTEDADEARVAAATDLRLASNLRDPLGVTERYPLPEGAFFCPPAADSDLSLPYKVGILFLQQAVVITHNVINLILFLIEFFLNTQAYNQDCILVLSQ